MNRSRKHHSGVQLEVNERFLIILITSSILCG